MIPVSDSVQSRTTPYVNIAFIAFNILIFLYQLTLSTFPDPQTFLSELDLFFFDWGSIPACLTERFGFDPETDPRLLAGVCPEGERVLATPFTSMFLHGGWLHLIGNLVFLWVFGDNVEDAMGHARYAVFYLVVGLIASASHIFMNQNDFIPAIGASGAVAGVLGAYLVLYPRATVAAILPIFILFLFPFRVPAVLLIGFWFLLQLFSGIAAITSTDVTGAGGIAWFAHIGGFIAGVLLVRVFTIGRGRRGRLRLVPGAR
jgi:membrane associated rhomboid family serine protease